MADETDFIDLYRRLHVPPHCTLAQFKQAYRRHVAQWHPDRRPGSRADAIAAARLQRLTAQYGAAMEFYRRHGRLPGAAQPPRMRVAATEKMVDVGHAAPAAAQAYPGLRPSARTLRTRWMLLVAAVGIATVVWSLTPAARVQETDEADEIAPIAVPAPPAAMLRPGMGVDEVLAVEGEPTRRGGDQWEYGPSWVRFDHGELSDWYSSPLRPLHVSSARASR